MSCAKRQWSGLGRSVGFLAASMVLAGSAWAQDTGRHFFGDYEYKTSCAVCHGPQGLGDGPMANKLQPTPADLTTLAKNNGGVFPYDAVFEMIDGRAIGESHGTREMPIWGERYARQVEQPIVSARILELTYYLRSIQAE